MSIPNLSGEPAAPAYCVVNRLDALATPAWGSAPPPWAPGRREEVIRVDRIAADGVVLDDRLVMLSKIDILADLNPEEMRAIMDAAPMRTYPAGTSSTRRTGPSRRCSCSSVAGSVSSGWPPTGAR